MKDKLELKHLAPYLPYKVEIQDKHGYIWRLDADTIMGTILWKHKPILRPLSDLTKPIIINGTRHLHMQEIMTLFEKHSAVLAKGCKDMPDLIPALLSSNDIFQKLLQYHFDVFNLIEKGLAIDYNTIK
jgi:hypothetical protein